MNDTSSQDAKVTLEDVIRLKRAERPPSEFWEQFDRELRAKQLAAIMTPRSWWSDWRRALASLQRMHVPAGALAALAITFVSVSRYQLVDSQQNDNGIRTVQSQADGLATNQPSPDSPEIPVNGNSTVSSTGRSGLAQVESIALAARSAETGTTTKPESKSNAAAWPSMAAAGESLNVRDIAQPKIALTGFELQANNVAASALSAMDSPRPNFESRNISGAAARPEPLTQIQVSENPRRSRLMALMDAPSALPEENAALERSRDRITSRLSEDQLYDSVRRLGGSADRLTLKF